MNTFIWPESGLGFYGCPHYLQVWRRSDQKWTCYLSALQMSMGAIGCHGNRNFDPICANTLCSLSPTPVMLYIKFDQDWPTCLRDIWVWKCGWTTHRWQSTGTCILRAFRWAKNKQTNSWRNKALESCSKLGPIFPLMSCIWLPFKSF